ncbi:MAG: alpha/beta hydrolase [Anaerolineales bacterium]
MGWSFLIEENEYHPILTRAEPFLFIGKTRPDIGCLLIHGFTGTPLEMRGLGKHLAKEGYTALGIRLAGHATNLEEMARTRWTDWFSSVVDGYEMLQAACERVFVMGLSLGGILALTLASRFPVAGAAVFSTPHHLPNDPRLRYIKLIALFKPYFPKGSPGWFDQDAYSRHVCYPADPTRGFGELVKLVRVMRSGLPQVKAPLLAIYSNQDPTLAAEDGHMEAILSEVGSDDKSSIWIEGSGHVITSDAKRQIVYEAASKFVSAHIK